MRPNPKAPGIDAAAHVRPPAVQTMGECLGEDTVELSRGQSSHCRRLLTGDEVVFRLCLSVDQVRFLIHTRQLTAIRIAGVERFDSQEIEHLIECYKTTASRRSQ